MVACSLANHKNQNTNHQKHKARRRSPARFASHHQKDSKANSERGKSPRETTTKDLPRHSGKYPLCRNTWEAHMTRPFFQPKSSPISRPMKPRRNQSHIPNSPRVVQKAPLLICVCEGVVLRQCDLIIRTSVFWR